MRRGTVLGSLLLLLLAAAALADGAAEARKQIQAVYDKQAAATARRDVAALYSPVAPDFMVNLPNGQHATRSQVLLNTKAAFARMRNPRCTITIKSFRLEGTIATATVASRVESTVLMDPKGTRTGKLLILQSSEETWTKGVGGWMKTQASVLTDKETIDGKPVGAARSKPKGK